MAVGGTGRASGTRVIFMASSPSGGICGWARQRDAAFELRSRKDALNVRLVEVEVEIEVKMRSTVVTRLWGTVAEPGRNFQAYGRKALLQEKIS